jgi:hypothetical protein
LISSALAPKLQADATSAARPIFFIDVFILLSPC